LLPFIHKIPVKYR